MRARVLGVTVGVVTMLAVAFLAAGLGPAEALRVMVRGTFGTPNAISGVLREWMPLLVAGAAVFVALRAGLFNIGAEGQLILGAVAAAAVGTRVPGVLGIVLAVAVAMLAGALWAFPAGWIRAYRNGHEVITTIMLNNIAIYLTDALVNGVLKDPDGKANSTAFVLTRIPNVPLGPAQANPALFVALALPVLVWIFFRRTVSGYEIEAVGENRRVADFSGIDGRAVMLRTMLASGAIAGLAGALLVLASEGRFYQGFSPGYGFNALGIALLAGGSGILVIPAAALFAWLERGGTALAINGVPKGVTTIVLGGLILIAAVVRYRRLERVD